MKNQFEIKEKIKSLKEMIELSNEWRQKAEDISEGTIAWNYTKIFQKQIHMLEWVLKDGEYNGS